MTFRGPDGIDQYYPDPGTAMDAVTALLGVGVGDRGYGQPTPAIPARMSYQEVTHTEWNALRAAMGNLNIHTGSGLVIQPVVYAGNIIIPQNGYDVVATANVQADIYTLDTNRLLFDPAQMNTNAIAISSNTVGQWSGSITHEFIVDFGTEDQARWFFNSGGAITINAARSGGGGNVTSNGTSFTSPAVYPVTYPPAWSSFMDTYAVWVDSGIDALAGATQTIYRNFTPAVSGTYTISYQADNQLNLYINDVNIGTSTDYSHPPSTVTYTFVGGQTYILKFEALNVSNSTNGTWIANPAGWAVIITNPSNQVVWDTKTHAPAETISPVTFTSPAVYAVSSTAGDWSTFMNNHAVWVDPNAVTYINVPQTRWRNLSISTSGTYTFTYAVDDDMTLYLDGTVIATVVVSSSRLNATPPSSKLYVPAGNHVLRFDVLNVITRGGWALVVTDSNGNVVWDARGHLPAETINPPVAVTSNTTVNDSMLSNLLASAGTVTLSGYTVADSNNQGILYGEGYWNLNAFYSPVYAIYAYTSAATPEESIVSPDLYAVSYPTAWSSFMDAHAVWVDSEVNSYVGKTQTSYRLFNPNTAGYYTLAYQGASTVTAYIDSATIGTISNSSGAPATANVYLSNDQHVLRFDTFNTSSNSDAAWSANPAGWAATLTDQTNAVVWDTATTLAQETIYYTPYTFPGIDPRSALSASYGSPNTSYTYKVPSNVTQLTVKLWGAGGAGGPNLNGISKCFPGGAGAFVQATIPVIPGETLGVYVGGGGLAGKVGTKGNGSDSIGGGGGGYTSIYRGTEPLLIAAGGGGSPGNNYRTDLNAGRGGCGGIDRGFPGLSCTGDINSNGGMQTAGGKGGNGLFGKFLQGGPGGYSNPFNNAGINGGGAGSGTWGGAGGGAGYFGGGGGDANDPDTNQHRSSCGGAGGSSYISPTATNVVAAISPDGFTSPMLGDRDWEYGICAGGSAGLTKGDDGSNGGSGKVAIYVVNVLSPPNSYNWVIQAKNANYNGLNEANGSLIHIQSTFSTPDSSTIIDGVTTSNAGRRKAAGVLSIAEPVFSTTPQPLPPVPPAPVPAPPPPVPPTCVPGNMYFALYAYDTYRWNGTPIARSTVLVPNNVVWNNVQDVYNYFGLSNTPPASTTISIGALGGWVLSHDTAIATYTAFPGLAKPTNGETVVAVVGYNAAGRTNTRTITTAGKINLSSYATLSYGINQSDGRAWGEAPGPGDDIYVDYSPDDTNWTQLSKTTVGSIGANTWNTVTATLPIAAKISSGVYLRYRQDAAGSIDAGAYDDSFAMTSMVATATSTPLIPTSWCTRTLAYLEFPSTGTWTIYITYSHAVWLWLNKVLYLNIDNDKGGVYTSSFTIKATVGTKYAWQMDMEHEEIYGFGYPYESIIKWSGPGVSQPTVIPATAFCYDANNPPSAAAVVDQINS